MIRIFIQKSLISGMQNIVRNIIFIVLLDHFQIMHVSNTDNKSFSCLCFYSFVWVFYSKIKIHRRMKQPFLLPFHYINLLVSL